MHGEEGHVCREREVAEVPQGLAASVYGGGQGLLCKRGARRALLGWVVVRLMSNDTPPPASAPCRRSRRFTNNRVEAASLVVEDGSNVSVTDIPSSPIEVPEPALTQPGLSRTSKKRKNGH
jgi:hypothetical protein